MPFTTKATEFSPPDIADGDFGEILKLGAACGVPVMFGLFTVLVLWGAHWPLALAVCAEEGRVPDDRGQWAAQRVGRSCQHLSRFSRAGRVAGAAESSTTRIGRPIRCRHGVQRTVRPAVRRMLALSVHGAVGEVD